MRMFAIAVAVAAALAWTGARAADAQSARQDVQKKEADAQQEVGKAKAQAHEDVSKAQADAQKTVADAQKDARKKEAGAHPVFTKDNFDVKGKVASASPSSITLHRDGLPDAKLDIDRNTKIELDGDQVSASQLRPGQDVKASFNLENDKPMAVEIKAKKTGAAKPGAAEKSGTERSPSTTGAH